ncbi:MAG: radical SAM family heme chaperone HemW [Candidatus Gastranaerophilales bacterium]|nr:radical SAM family heme chaperone HemW [Candidatus Gastranaerophilales bacterium]
MVISVKKPLNSLYLHVPFCKDRCFYCSFVSLVDKNNYKENYINAVLAEMDEVLNSHKSQKLDSIYIGGGTPSLLEIKYFELIFSRINSLSNISKDAEITIEVNPGTIDADYLKSLKSLGINRLSIGIQSFNDDILKSINRIHNKNEAAEAVNMAKNAGFDNISIDLIYGLPGQNLNIWEDTLNQAIKLDIQHISTYGLKIEEGTVFAEKTPPNLPDEDMSVEMYLKTIGILKKNNFEHYEISNFAKSNRESKHNLAYWHNEEYFGFGLGAHGYTDGIRYSNTCSIEKYIENPFEKASEHKVTIQEAIEEGIFLGLRLTKGIDVNKFNSEYRINLMEKYESVINKYINLGFMDIKEGYLRLTTEGILISNTILAEFIE